ncbi:MAG: aldose 1-epimerase [Parafilimonas sp.]
MSYETIISGTGDDKKILLRNKVSETEAEIFSFGALLNSFSIPHNGKLQNVVDGFSNVDEARKEITPGFKSAKLSPFVCRLKNGEYQFNERLFITDKFFLKEHALHGLLYDADFILADYGADDNKAFVKFVYHYKNLNEGFPFPYKTEITYQLEEQNRLFVTTQISNEGKTALPLADGWHPYFTLGKTIDDCSLQFESETMLEFDAGLIPTKEKIDDTRFLHPSSLEGIGLDNCFELKKYINKPRCFLKNENLTLAIEPDASYPYLQIYTPPHRRSIAIENVSSAPDAFNNKMGLIILQPGEQRVFKTAYQIFGNKS